MKTPHIFQVKVLALLRRWQKLRRRGSEFAGRFVALHLGRLLFSLAQRTLRESSDYLHAVGGYDEPFAAAGLAFDCLFSRFFTHLITSPPKLQ